MRRHRCRHFTNLLGLALLVAAPALGQVTTGSLSGFVFDPSERPIARAKLRLSDNQHALLRQTTTDATGFYQFADLAPSVYSVVASAGGFSDVNAADVRVDVDSHVRADFHLHLAGRRESVTVRSEVRSIQTESSEIGTVLDQQRIESLPLNRRDFLQLALLTPGVLPPVQDSQLSTRGSFAMHANGGREEFNDFLLDGVDNNDQDTNRYILQPPVDAIQEFKIGTNSYSAEYGRNAGGQVNVITRSGTNDLHGFLYDYLRNRVFDARNFFDGAERPQYQRNQFGFGVGGPAIKNRTFFFLNLDGLTERRAITRLGTVPTVAERTGNLSDLGKPIVDPLTQTPFPGNIIPISPQAQNVLNLFPLPNRPGSAENHVAQPVLRDNEWQANGRLDHRLTSVDQLTLRYSYGYNNLYEPFAEQSTQIPGFGDYLRDRGHNALIHYTHVFGSGTLNSLLIGFNRSTRKLLQQNYGTDVNKLWGVDYLPTRPIDFGFPTINVSGLSTVGDVGSLPIDRATTTYQFSDDLSFIRGGQALQIGGQVRLLQLNGIVEELARGSMSFSGFLSGAGIADLLLGYPTFSIQSEANNTQTLRTKAFNLYVQDNWKIRPSLTLNLGLRYEYNRPPTDPTNRMSVFDLQTGQVVRVGTNGVSRSGLRSDWDNFAPRVGFAWTPRRTFVVRGGYGLYYDAGIVEANSSLYFNPPWFNIFVFVTGATSLLTLENPFPSSAGFTPPPSLATLSSDLTTGYVQSWNLNLQQEVRGVGTLSVAYVGSKGTHLIRSRDLNQPPPAPGDLQARRLYPDFGNIFFAESGGNSSFNSLQVWLNRQMKGGLSLLAAYTVSKSIDDTSAFLATPADPNFPQNSRDYHLERALSSFDMPQRATVGYVYRFPGRSWWNRNTETSGIFVAQTGQPFTPVLQFDNSNTGNVGGSAGSDRPDLLHHPELAQRGPNEWFDTSAFAIPPPYTFGTAGRNIVRGPGLASFDVSLARRFSWGERYALRFEAQAFNLFNRANFDLPQLYADSPNTFGKIFSAKAPRQIQFALRFTF